MIRATMHCNDDDDLMSISLKIATDAVKSVKIHPKMFLKLIILKLL